MTIYEIDFTPLLIEENPSPAYSALKNPERFAMVKGDYALMWLSPEKYEYDEEVIDMAPECVRFFCERWGGTWAVDQGLFVINLFEESARVSGTDLGYADFYCCVMVYRCFPKSAPLSVAQAKTATGTGRATAIEFI